MKILSNKTYNYLLSFKNNYDKLIEKEARRLDDIAYRIQCDYSNRLQKMETDLYKDKVDAIKREKHKYQELEDNIVSLKNKINILTKKTK